MDYFRKYITLLVKLIIEKTDIPTKNVIENSFIK